MHSNGRFSWVLIIAVTAAAPALAEPFALDKAWKRQDFAWPKKTCWWRPPTSTLSTESVDWISVRRPLLCQGLRFASQRLFRAQTIC
jgi:hypothetical protein